MVGGDGLDRRHSRCKRDALPTELTAPIHNYISSFNKNNNKELTYLAKK